MEQIKPKDFLIPCGLALFFGTIYYITNFVPHQSTWSTFYTWTLLVRYGALISACLMTLSAACGVLYIILSIIGAIFSRLFRAIFEKLGI